MRVLDEVATAINLARDQPGPRPIVSAFGLDEQFTYTLHPKGWDLLRRHLACPLPPLAFVQGQWFLPDDFANIWDLVEVAADAHPEWERPVARTEAAWRNAQVFAGVKVTLVDALGVDPEQVTREARLSDLGAS